jgi:hypothetical protein
LTKFLWTIEMTVRQQFAFKRGGIHDQGVFSLVLSAHLFRTKASSRKVHYYGKKSTLCRFQAPKPDDLPEITSYPLFSITARNSSEIAFHSSRLRRNGSLKNPAKLLSALQGFASRDCFVTLEHCDRGCGLLLFLAAMQSQENRQG